MALNKTIFITGATGFLGKSVLGQLLVAGFNVKSLERSVTEVVDQRLRIVKYHGLDSAFSVVDDLAGCDALIHCAARVHIMRDTAIESLSEFRNVNLKGTIELARQAAFAGVRRFIFISSVKVNGECNIPGSPFKETDPVLPVDPYGVSKCEAEQGLWKLSQETDLEVVIIRPPLVYGPGVKGNFLKLMKLARTGVPLPFGSIHNQRSMIYLGNLVDLIVKCIDHPAAANQTLLASDGQDLSTTDLLTALRINMGLSPRLLPVPQSLFHLLGRLTGKSAQVARLCGSLQVDNSKARILLDWLPPYTVEYGLKQTVNAFINGS